MNSIANYFRLVVEDREPGLLAEILKPLLSLLSFCYGVLVTLVQRLYQIQLLPSERLPFPVISVGNLTWGGTGKTPLVEYLAQRVIERRRTPLILTRGYGQDEVAQFRAHLPAARMGVGKNRNRIALEWGRKERISVAILDDGLQHWNTQRDIEIISLNALNPFGNGRLIPRGILREPLRALRRATVIVLTHTNLVSPAKLEELRKEIQKAAPSAAIVEAYLVPLFFYRASKRNRLSIDQLTNRRVATFSGLGSPRSFQLLLAHHGIKPARNFEYGDHHTFSIKELQEVRQVSEKGEVDEIITTEKDFFRSQKAITEVLDPLVLAAHLRIAAGEEILTDHIFRLIGVG